MSSLLFLINFSLSNIKSRAGLFKTEKERSSNSSLILFMPIRSAKGAYISIVSFAFLTILSLSFTKLIVLILCSLSANLTSNTRISFEVAKINFLKFSAFELFETLSSSAEIFVTPSTKFATSSPNSFFTVSNVTLVSSIVSCNKPVVIVALSSFNSVKIFATATGCIM